MSKRKSDPLLYTGPVSSFSVMKKPEDGKEPESEDRSLVTGETYGDLPRDHPVIQNLIAAKLLIPPPPEATVAESETGTADDDSSTKEGNAK